MIRALLALAVAGALAGGGWLLLDGDHAAPRRGPLDPGLTPASPFSPAAVSLEDDDVIDVRFRRPPKAALLFDVGTGQVLWRRNPLEVRPIASLTKTMTALVVVTEARARERARIPATALKYEGRGVGVLKRGKRVPVEALLASVLITSANDAAIAVAHHVAGSVPAFAELMNERARLLGLGCSRFVSPHGVENGNRSCAADLAALTRLAMANARIARLAKVSYAQIRAPVRGKRLYLATTNPLLAAGYKGTIGLKTGFTEAAGRSLIAVVRRHGRTLGVVLLDSPNPGKQAIRLFDVAFRKTSRE